MTNILTSLLIVVAALAGTATSAFAQQKPPARGIVNVTGQLYRAQNDNHYTVFLVTPQGIIMSDPINRDFARWLKAEFATRFKVPVRYLLYTHKDWDHASGGVVFADTAEFVGHANMRAGVALPPGNPPLPGDAVKMDVRGALAYATLKFLQRDAKVTDFNLQFQQVVEGYFLQLTNRDESRTFAYITMHENRLYVFEGTTPKGYPEPGLFQGSVSFVDAKGNSIRYTDYYSNAIHGLRQYEPPPVRGGN